MYIFDNSSHEYKTRRIFELRIKCYYDGDAFTAHFRAKIVI